MTDTCEKHCEANAFKIVIRGLEGEVARLKERLADPMRDVQRLGQEIEQDHTYGYASRLAVAIWQKHYMKDAPKWKPLDTTEGVLTQIDNMTCGLVKEKPAQPEQEIECPECKAEVLYECVACSSNNYPPQRTWVGLTDDDDIDWEEGGNLKDLVKAIEAKLKQKNGYAEEKNAICSPFMISELWRLQK